MESIKISLRQTHLSFGPVDLMEPVRGGNGDDLMSAILGQLIYPEHWRIQAQERPKHINDKTNVAIVTLKVEDANARAAAVRILSSEFLMIRDAYE